MASEPLKITNTIEISGWELIELFTTASGPGGQNVNKVATAVELRFAAMTSPSLPERVKLALPALAGRKLTKDGVLVIFSDRFRSQERNREDAREKLRELLAEAAKPPPPKRRPTRPTKGSVERRLKEKAGRSTVKKMRGKPGGQE